MDTIFTEASIEDSFIYKSFNASNGLLNKIVKYIKTSTSLDKTYFEEQYSQIKKSSISPLSNKVLDAFDNGHIELLFSRDTKIGTSIPFIIRRNDKGEVVATIFITSFSNIDKDDNLTIPVKQLYALMESAYVALKIQEYPAGIQRDTTLMKICTSTYTEIIMRIINKDYAVSLDKALYDKISYALNRFFLTNIWQFPNKDLIHNYASMDLKYIENMDLELLRDEYTDHDIKDINDLFIFLRGLSPRLKEINIRFFIERFINTYHGSSIMCLDYLPYTFFVIINVLLGSFLISQQALNDIIKNIKNMNKFYSELARIM